ncbi:hypothetical protein A2U01_0055738, partial [Trifolium medium]|nr:hypothetical protein [Trifolium medium]
MYRSEFQQGHIYPNSSDESDSDDGHDEDGTEQEVIVAPERPQRTRQAPAMLNDYEVTSDSAVNDEGELIQFSLLADSEPIHFKDALK